MAPCSTSSSGDGNSPSLTRFFVAATLLPVVPACVRRVKADSVFGAHWAAAAHPITGAKAASTVPIVAVSAATSAASSG